MALKETPAPVPYSDSIGNMPAVATPKALDPSVVVEKMLPDDDTTQGGTGDDPFAFDDPNAVEGDGQVDDHGAVIDESIGAMFNSIYDQFKTGAMDAKEAMKKVKHLFDTHGKLKETGDAGDLPDLDADADQDLDAEPETDDDEVEEDDDTDDLPNKKKKGLVWRDEDCETMKGVYKFLSALVIHPKPDKGKIEKHCTKLLAQMESIAPVEIVLKELKAKTPKGDELPPDALDQILVAVRQETGGLLNRIANVDTQLNGVPK